MAALCLLKTRETFWHKRFLFGFRCGSCVPKVSWFRSYHLYPALPEFLLTKMQNELVILMKKDGEALLKRF